MPPQDRISSKSRPISVSGDITPVKTLTKFDRKLVKWGKRVGKREGEEGILLEGIKLVEEALTAGHPLIRAWYTMALHEAYPGLISRLVTVDCEVKPVSQRIMKSISDLETPPGIVAVAPQPGFIHRKSGDPFSLIVAISRIQDPGNLGGIVRTADYFGADEVWLGPGSVDPYSSKVIRGTMGATFRMPVLKRSDLIERIKVFRKAGARVWAAVAHDDKAAARISSSGARILLMGGESGGLGGDYLEIADKSVSIPGAHRAESLNLAVAAGILIYGATSGRFKKE